MSKYNKYARDLNKAFRQAKEEHEKALDAYKKALDAENKAKENYNEIYAGERNARMARASAMVIETKAALDETIKKEWKAFKAEMERLTKELNAEVSKDFIMMPGAVDAQAVELIKSGIMTPEDLHAMAGNYANNPTMLRYINRYAEQARNEKQDNAEMRAAYAIVAQETKGQDTIILENWKEITRAGLTYSGMLRDDHPSAELINSLSNHWEDENVQSAIENF